MNRRREIRRKEADAKIAALRNTLQETNGVGAVQLLAQLLTAVEVAELLSLDLGTVRNLTYRRELPCVKVGPRGVRYRLLDLLTWIEERTRPTL
ncbi:MAG: helix-turn-helix domain-containing protein [Candidatus Binatia bacterium]